MTELLVNMENNMFTYNTLNILNDKYNNEINTNNATEKQKKYKNAIKTENKKILPTFFSIKDKDNLFWCYYIIKYGIIKYESLLNNTFAEEQREKIQLIEIIRNNKEVLKKNKWKRNAIEGELISNNNISVKTFLCICAINNLNISIVTKLYLFIQNNVHSSDNNIIYYNNDSYKLSILDRVEKDKLLEEYKKDHWIINNIDKPLLALSSYKLSELQNIAKKLQIPIHNDKNKRFCKQELYKMIKIKILN